jgi:hypothetical protein
MTRPAAALLALTSLAATPPPARADDFEVSDVGFQVVVPDAYRQRPELADGIVRTFHDPAALLGQKYHAGGLIFVRESPRGGMYALWRVSDAAVPDWAQAVRQELDDMQRHPGAVRSIAALEQIRDKVAAVRYEYQPAAETYILGNGMVFVGETGRVHVVRIECVMPIDHAAELRPECERAANSLRVVLPAASLRALAGVSPKAAGDPQVAQLAQLAQSGAPAPSSKLPSPPAAPTASVIAPPPGASERVGPIVVEPGRHAPSAARRLIWTGAGLLVVAVLISAIYRSRRRT